MTMPNPIRSMTTTAKTIIIAVRGAATPARSTGVGDPVLLGGHRWVSLNSIRRFAPVGDFIIAGIDGLKFPEAGGGETVGGDSRIDQEFDDRYGAGGRQLPIARELGGADGDPVGMAIDPQNPIDVLGDSPGNLPQRRCELTDLILPGNAQLGGPCGEQDFALKHEIGHQRSGFPRWPPRTSRSRPKKLGAVPGKLFGPCWPGPHSVVCLNWRFEPVALGRSFSEMSRASVQAADLQPQLLDLLIQQGDLSPCAFGELLLFDQEPLLFDQLTLRAFKFFRPSP